MESSEEQELSRKVALACGWTATDDPRQMRMPDAMIAAQPRGQANIVRTLDWLPAFATSLDACFGPGGPIEFMRAQGWIREQYDWPDGSTSTRIWFSAERLDAHEDRPDVIVIGEPATAASVLCEAFLAAVEATRTIEVLSGN